VVVDIGGRLVGDGQPCFIVAELGLNHQGDVQIAKRMIDAAKDAGADAVKFQKRTPRVCVPSDQWDIVKDTPFGRMSYIEYKERIEFGQDEYEQIDAYCKRVGMLWFASCWDADSVEFIRQFDPPCYKIASATLTDHETLSEVMAQNWVWGNAPHAPLVALLSTGMSTFNQIDWALEHFWKEQVVLLHARSTYPAALDELNLNMIPTLAKRYGVPVGYSGHESGLATTVAAVALGACVIERHLTLDRALPGTDHAASVEPHGFARLVKDIRSVEQAFGDGQQREYESEAPIRLKLRGDNGQKRQAAYGVVRQDG
jgi:N-acetylneuraminate synthase